VEEQGDALCEVPHHRVTLAEEPVRGAGQLERPAHQRPHAEEPLGAPAGEEPQRPRRVAGRRLAKVAAHRRHLGQGGGGGVERLVEIREPLHGSKISGGPTDGAWSRVRVPSGSPPSQSGSWSRRCELHRWPETPKGRTSVVASGSAKSTTRRMLCPKRGVATRTQRSHPESGGDGGLKIHPSGPPERPKGCGTSRRFFRPQGSSSATSRTAAPSTASRSPRPALRHASGEARTAASRVGSLLYQR